MEVPLLNLADARIGDVCEMGDGTFVSFNGMSGHPDEDLKYLVNGNYYGANGRYHGYSGPPTWMDVIALYRPIGRNPEPLSVD